MKYLHKFSDTDELMDAVAADDNVFVSLTDDWGVSCCSPVTVYSNDYSYVDLGLPSGILWATEEYDVDGTGQQGGVPWGMNKKGKIPYAGGYAISCSNNTYAFYDSTNQVYTKYNGEDWLTNLRQGGNDPTVTMNLAPYYNGQWFMPGGEEAYELITNTTQEWITRDGVQGCLFTSNTNNNTLFMPGYGCWWGTGTHDSDWVYIWLADLDYNGQNFPEEAYCLHIRPSDNVCSAQIISTYRCYGLHIWPVIRPYRFTYHLPGNNSGGGGPGGVIK